MGCLIQVYMFSENVIDTLLALWLIEKYKVTILFKWCDVEY